jgi:hypothetical protein
VDVVFDSAAPVVDVTPPTVTTTVPAANASGVSASAPLTVTFSEPIDPATITTGTIQLRNAANAVVTSTVTYDAAARKATLHPTGGLTTGASYTARVAGGTTDPRIKDLAGNALASDAAWSFTTASGVVCPCSLWGSPVIGVADAGDANAVELGVKFRSDVDGYVTGVRYYKSAANSGTHIGNLWTTSGTRLATATFASESATGWQQVTFANPVAIAANTIYIASYHTNAGHYAATAGYHLAALDSPPLHTIANAISGNGVYAYGASAFPSNTFNATNYWVDVIFESSILDSTPPTVTATSPAAGASNIAPTAAVTVTFSESVDPSTVNTSTLELRDAANTAMTGAVAYNAATRTATLTPAAALTAGATYTARVRGGTSGPAINDLAGNALTADVVFSFTAGAGINCPCTIWPASAVPAIVDAGDANALELGVKFRTDTDGFITGVRFYKSAANTGAHTAHLWTSTGTLLASAPFTGETASGWQQVNFASPVAVTANTSYVASYHTNTGHYSASGAYFASAGVDTPPLHAFGDATGANGVYLYGPAGFPSSSYNATNYWVDVVFVP